MVLSRLLDTRSQNSKYCSLSTLHCCLQNKRLVYPIYASIVDNVNTLSQNYVTVRILYIYKYIFELVIARFPAI